MRLLCLDSSTKKFSLAAAEDGRILRYSNSELGRILSDSIVPSIEMLLKKASLDLKDIDVFCAGLGPGSFTSLRVGVSTVKAFADALNKPVVGVSSLDLIAQGMTKKTQKDICVFSDARRKMVYTAMYAHREGQLVRTSEYALQDPVSVLKKIKGPAVIAGDGIALYRNEIQKYCKNAELAEEKDWYPQARHMPDLARERLTAKAFDSSETLTPLYLYPEDCQVTLPK